MDVTVIETVEGSATVTIIPLSSSSSLSVDSIATSFVTSTNRIPSSLSSLPITTSSVTSTFPETSHATATSTGYSPGNSTMSQPGPDQPATTRSFESKYIAAIVIPGVVAIVAMVLIWPEMVPYAGGAKPETRMVPYTGNGHDTRVVPYKGGVDHETGMAPYAGAVRETPDVGRGF